jgi:hypothetical protein
VGQSSGHGWLIVVTTADAWDLGVASERGSGWLTAGPNPKLELELEFEFQN